MGSQTTAALYIVLLIAVVGSVDFLFLRNHAWARLAVNIGIVVMFSAFYLIFLKRP